MTGSIRTNRDREIAEQQRWRLRAGLAPLRWFDHLLDREFITDQEQRLAQEQALTGLIRFAATEVPYYRDLFRQVGLSPSDLRLPQDLSRLPILSKRQVYEHGEQLQPSRVPSGTKRYGIVKSSGTTGRPTHVVQSVLSNRMFAILGQRQFRWFRFDPSKTLAAIRLPGHLPRTADGTVLSDGATSRLAKWRYVGKYFHTGPECCFNVTNPVEKQIAWLEQLQPTYLMSYSESLEHLALACEGRNPMNRLEGVWAISEQLTPSMRRRIERTFGVPVHQNYGLNEIGRVAVRCAAGRYHVHSEHCIVQIVDEDGQPCSAGRTGRVVVTGLKNPTMPLLRYDTDDMAEAVEGPCPCGRTLPAFGELSGRYSRIAYLPANTLAYVGALRDALERMPDEMVVHLRQYQIHQTRDDRFELRLLTTAPMTAAFDARINEAWREAVGDAQFTLTITRVDQIARSRGGKFLDFTSDYVPEADG